MPSSPTPPLPAQPARLGRVSRLLQVLGELPDPRRRRGVRHGLVGVLALGLCAVLSGARSYAAIAQWAQDLDGEQLRELGLTRSYAPNASTFRRLFMTLDAAVLDAVIGAFMWTRTRTINGRRVIAIDGKTVRGARTATGDDGAGGTTAPHLVAALDHATGTVLGQLATAAKSNEIPTVRTLSATFDLKGVVVTVDAMHTQIDTATAIIDAGGDYVFTVKGNQPKLYAACKNLPWKDVPSHTSVQKGHGRRAHRAIKVLTAPAWITFAGAAQVAQVRRTTTRGGKKNVEVVYVITSADHLSASPAILAAWIQDHWGIENRAH